MFGHCPWHVCVLSIVIFSRIICSQSVISAKYVLITLDVFYDYTVCAIQFILLGIRTWHLSHCPQETQMLSYNHRCIYLSTDNKREMIALLWQHSALLGSVKTPRFSLKAVISTFRAFRVTTSKKYYIRDV